MWYSVCFCNGRCITVCSLQKPIEAHGAKIKFYYLKIFFISNKDVVGTEDRKFLLRDSEK